MFTGIIEQTGKVAGLHESRLLIDAPILVDAPIGASVSVNGACLTVVETTGTGAGFDVIPETFSRTNLGGLGIGDSVNLERAMPATGRFDGHIVQGHVDGTGAVVSFDEGPDGTLVTVETTVAIAAQIVPKGSITIDGVSLTVVAVDDTRFSVALIPHTLELTTLGSLRPGDTVNLETDILAKYIQRLVNR